jgi:hypothetical protein
MDEESQRAIAVWIVFVVPFLVVGGLFYVRNQLTLEVITLYWSPAILLTIIGAIPAPWHPITK